MQSGDEFARPELLVDWFEIEGPINEVWPPTSHQELLPNNSKRRSDERGYARDIVKRVMRRAFRRPVSDSEIDEKMALFDRIRRDTSFEEALKSPLTSVLVSPHFLYLVEPGTAARQLSRLSLPSDKRYVQPFQISPRSGEAIQSLFQPTISTFAKPVFPPASTLFGFQQSSTKSKADEYPTFKFRSGRKITGKVVEFKNRRVKLLKPSGKTISLYISLFGKEDQERIQKLASQPAKPTPKPTIPKPTSPSPSIPPSTSPSNSRPVVGESPSTGPSTLPSMSARRLNDFEMASRLSYFLWSTMPDDELLDLAEAGRLRDPAVIQAQVDRMLSDPKSDSFIRNFAGQWLGLREVGANPPAPDLYPRYDRHLEVSIVKESLAFFGEILRNNLSVMNFVKSDFVVVNERIARFYGIPNVRGDEFRSVKVPRGVSRGGIVTQASVLTITSNGTRTSPVKRGTWVMKNILGIDPGLPVANAGDIAPKVPGIDRATVRQRLEIHRSLPQCARCHNKIDPLGFALENFNASGEWREQEGFGYKGRIQPNDPPINAASKMIDGTAFEGVEGLQRILMRDEDLFLGCLSNKMMTYALGRELGIADQLHVQEAVKHLKRNGKTLPALIQFVVASELFQTK